MTSRRPIGNAAAAIMFAALSFGAAADVWFEIGVNDKFTSYADPATIKKKDYIATMWTMNSYKAPQTGDGGKKYLSIKLHYEFDCKDERVRPLSGISFSEANAKGDKVGESNMSLPSTRVERDTVNSRLLEYACRK
jgi:hypothetical protein